MRSGLRVVLGVALIVALTLGAGCGTTSTTESKHALDESIHGVEDAIAGFYLLGPDAPTTAAITGVARITDAWREVVDASGDVTGVDLTAATAAYDALAAATGSLAEDDPRPMDTLMPLVKAFQAEVDALHEAGGFH